MPTMWRSFEGRSNRFCSTMQNVGFYSGKTENKSVTIDSNPVTIYNQTLSIVIMTLKRLMQKISNR